ncbi:phosphoglycerate dehydrogenase [Aciditerrimonas ferrireducens]|uniref:Phosphoglycerate dehydrogenase n=1 Tax=Aciditerrimonas ferrireducens TaxID=667306 RepID=A0ABV6C3D8_9ACTN
MTDGDRGHEAGPRRALLLENIHPDAVAVLEGAGFEVETERGALSEDQLIERVADVSVLGIRSRTQVTRRVLEAAPRLTVLGAFCIGTNQIDLPAATERGVAVFNAPFSNTRSVVELAICEIIALTRQLTDKNAKMHAGVWDKSATGAHEVRGRRLGIVGYGNIGSQLSVVAEAMGMQVLFYDTAEKLAIGNARPCGSLHELLESVDIVTLHVDGRPANRQLFGEEEFARMRPGSIFLNLSRGFVVDHEALRRHLVSGHLAGAAIDVFPKEPAGPGEPFESELRGLPNVILTPHIGGSTEEAQQDIGGFVAGKLVRYLTEGTTTLSVNLPGLSLPAPDSGCRLLYVHRNVPGVLGRVNSLIGSFGVNVDGEVLGTKGDIGYLIADISCGWPDELLDQLADLDCTIAVRVVTLGSGPADS